MLAKTFRDRNGFGEQHLLVFAEQLLVKVFRASGAHHAGSKYNDV